jgi:hypothetical protein
MFESGKKGYAAKKAYEIAYALFRISAKIAESGVKDRLESQAMDLLISANAEEYGNAAKTIAAIDALVKFSVDLNMISIANGDVLLREIAVMNDAVIECIDQSDEVDASKFFSKSKDVVMNDVTHASSSAVFRNPSVIVRGGGRPVLSHSRISEKAGIQEQEPSVASREQYSVSAVSSSVVPAQAGTQEESNPSVLPSDPSVTLPDSTVIVPEEGRPVLPSFPMTSESGSATSVIKSGNRKIAILDKIRQSGNCKLREIQEILPDCSERTIRYDLEELIERNLVERIGSGGPAVSYRVRQLL